MNKKKSELKEILDIHKQAFDKGKGVEIAKLVSALMDDKTAKPLVSLVAIENDEIVGHILFTKAIIQKTKVPGFLIRSF